MQKPSLPGENIIVGSNAAAARMLQGKAGLTLFIATIFLSAFLLFALEPLFAKMVLPVLGGSSSVWAVALLFFQGALLAGYAYVDLLFRWVPFKWTGPTHIALALLAVIVLPIGLPSGWTEPPPGEPYFWQLELFSVAIGLPFIAVAANAPLLQTWFARSGHPHAYDPYFLYAASNLGSLAALLSYPFLLEPAFGLTALSRYWSLLYLVLIASLALCFTLVQRFGTEPRAPAVPVPDEPDPEAPTVRDRLAWCGLAMVPAALLTAFTTHVATDVASAPLLWVIPLAIYLLTFVLAFAETIAIPMRFLLPAHLIAVVFALIELSQVKYDKWVLTSGAGFAVFFLSALVAHRTLFLMRPRARYLTGFYLWLSLGGVLGGLFAALVAPKIFSEVYEYPLLIALTVACRPGIFAQRTWRMADLLWLAAILAVGLPLVERGDIWAIQLGLSFGEWGFTPVLALFFAIAAIAFWGHPQRQLLAVMLMCAAVVNLPSAVKRGIAQRSYYGIYRVMQSENGEFNVLTHGTTLHGAQRIRGKDGHIVSDTNPVTYYYPGSPMERAVRITQNHLDMRGETGHETGRFGVVGLGTGSLGCYSRKGEQWRYFEIDPTVVEIAAKSNFFTFLANCLPSTDIVIGDARRTIAKEPDQSFDLIIVDAFSSDAVPVHLLTAEALRLYASKIKDTGFLVLHISNRYLDLDSVLGATLRLVPELKGLIVADDKADGTYAENISSIAVFAKDNRMLDDFRALQGVADFRAGRLSPWTDDASDILGPFISQWRLTH